MAKYNKEIVNEICKLVRNGVFNKDAAEAVGISEETFYKWQRKELPNGEPNPEYHPEFAESLKRAEANRKKNFVLAIAKASNKSWQAAAWYLERVYNTEFAKREIKEHKIDPKKEMEKIDRKLEEKWRDQSDSTKT